MIPVLSMAIRRNALCSLILEDLENTCFVLTGKSAKSTARGPPDADSVPPLAPTGHVVLGKGLPLPESQFAHNQSQTG